MSGWYVGTVARWLVSPLIYSALPTISTGTVFTMQQSKRFFHISSRLVLFLQFFQHCLQVEGCRGQTQNCCSNEVPTLPIERRSPKVTSNMKRICATKKRTVPSQRLNKENCNRKNKNLREYMIFHRQNTGPISMTCIVIDFNVFFVT